MEGRRLGQGNTLQLICLRKDKQPKWPQPAALEGTRGVTMGRSNAAQRAEGLGTDSTGRLDHVDFNLVQKFNFELRLS